MSSRKNNDKLSKASSSKESDIQVSGLSVTIAQSKPNPSEKSKQAVSKIASTSKASPRRKFHSRTGEDVRPASPSPSRSSPTTSSSQTGEDYRALQRKLSARSRCTEGQGKSKVAIRVADDGRIHMKRGSDERNLDPDRLIVDKCDLGRIPVLECEEQLRLLNLQQNGIGKIEHLDNLPLLTCLDLSDNAIGRISGMDALVQLRMLFLARNRIRAIDGLQKLHHLDVLDLSGNEIEEVSGVCHLSELRVLNLSSNQIVLMRGLRGLKSLVELNLSKNAIAQVEDVDAFPRLQRLFLANNSIERLEGVWGLSRLTLLSDLTLEGNPVASLPNYRHLVLFNVPHLKALDSRRALDEERRTAHALMRKEEQKRQEGIRQARLKEAKVRALSRARELWESTTADSSAAESSSLVSQEAVVASALPLHLLTRHTSSSYSEEEEDAACSCCGGQGNAECCQQGKTRGGISNGHKHKKAKGRKNKDAKIKRHSSDQCDPLSDPGLTYLAEVESGSLRLFGAGAVGAALAHPWPPNQLQGVKQLQLHFVRVEEVPMGRLRALLKNMQEVVLECCGVSTLSQLNHLGAIAGLRAITIGAEGNPVLKLALWRHYAVYRLSPDIERINGVQVTELERVQAEELFGGLGLAASHLLPKYRLAAILNTPRVKQMFLKEQGYSPNSLRTQPDSQAAGEVLKAALSYSTDFEQMGRSAGCGLAAKHLVGRALTRAQGALWKRAAVGRCWPNLFVGVVQDALDDCSDLDHHMKLAMQSLLMKKRKQHET